MLEPSEEYMLAKRWREHGDCDAAHKLVTSHLRLVAKIAKLFFNLRKVTLPRIISAYKVSQPTVRRRRVQSRSAPERDDAGQGDG
jgi:DNA-directed RNA polymerase sigma subunit (sigma70/sigma32)